MIKSVYMMKMKFRPLNLGKLSFHHLPKLCNTRYKLILSHEKAPVLKKVRSIQRQGMNHLRRSKKRITSTSKSYSNRSTLKCLGNVNMKSLFNQNPTFTNFNNLPNYHQFMKEVSHQRGLVQNVLPIFHQ